MNSLFPPEYLADLAKKKAEYEKNTKKGKKIDFEFQELGIALKDYFGINLFWIFYRAWCSEAKVRKALDICKAKGKKDVSYFIGIIKKL